MTPELEVLEQILDDSLPLAGIVSLFPDLPHCKRALHAMIRDGQVVLRDPNGEEVPLWKLRDIGSDPNPWHDGSGYRLHITDLGAEMVA